MNNNPSIVFSVALLSLCANNSIEPAKWNKSTCFTQSKSICALIARIQQSREQIARGDYMVVDPNNVWGSIL